MPEFKVYIEKTQDGIELMTKRDKCALWESAIYQEEEIEKIGKAIEEYLRTGNVKAKD